MADHKPAWTIDAADVVRSAQALFAFRKKAAAEKDPRDRHPALYATYEWDNLPASERIYYCDMVAISLTRLGIAIPNMPEFEAA